MGWVRTLLFLGCLGSLGGLAYVYWQYDRGSSTSVLIRGAKQKVRPHPARYKELTEELRRWQTSLAEKYEEAESDRKRDEIAHDARVIFELVVPEMMRCWLGTGYDFNGIAREPGEGKIACGYFVSTVLRDAGFKVDRYELAQQPSGNIMRSFIPRKVCRLKIGVDYEEYGDWLEEREDGIYLIGLDTHVGFILVRNSQVRFFHSSGIGKKGVVNENREAAEAIRRSDWRLLGPLTPNRGFIEKWLMGKEIKVRKL